VAAAADAAATLVPFVITRVATPGLLRNNGANLGAPATAGALGAFDAPTGAPAPATPAAAAAALNDRFTT